MVIHSQDTQPNEYKLLSEIIISDDESLLNASHLTLDSPSQNGAVVGNEIKVTTASMNTPNPHYQKAHTESR